ncbi:MAG: DUF6443 domain-containing protein [Candidatus Cyclobacteriaceae bacterium M2_1C_046]
MKAYNHIFLFSALLLISFSLTAQIGTNNIGDPGGVNEPPATPPNPTASTNTCGNKTLYRNGTPPDGVLWYWQTSSLGTSISDHSSSKVVSSSGTYYIRAYDTGTTLWSSGSGSVTVTVNALPTVDAGSTQSACKNSGNITLTGGSPTGGTWSGNYVSSGVFNTSTAPAGNHIVTYSFTDSKGCTNSDTKTFTVNALPTVDAGSNQSACKNSGNITLTGGSPTGGIWSGNYVSSGVFNTSTAPAGNHTVTYSFTDAKGCVNSDIKTFTVNALPTVDAGSNQSACKNSGKVALTGGSPTGGSWSGNSYVLNGTFDTNLAPAGNYIVNYSFIDANGCTNSDTKTFTVNALPTVDAGSTQSACKNSGSIILTGGIPTGGTWSGSYVSSGAFNTNTAPAGNYVVNYSFTDANGCTNSDTKTFTVKALPTVDAGSNQSACKNSGSITLTGGSPTGGTWSGSYVSSGSFNTNTAPAGNYTVTYSFTEANGCTNSDVKTFTVHALPTVDAGSTQTACKNSGSVSLTGATPTGGTWSGSYVSSGVFNTSTAPAGNHIVTYSFTDSKGCTNSDTKTFTVNALPTVDAGSTQSACKNSGNITLTGGSPTSGTWSGNYVSSGVFNTSTAPAGNHIVTYSFTDSKGCTNSDTKTFTVKALPTVDAGSNQSACKNSGSITLTGATPTGGTWSGSYVSSGAINTNTAPAGNYTVTYSFTDANGCTNSDVKTFTVHALPTVDAGSTQSACKNSGSVSLTGGSPTGGTWSGSYVSSGAFNTNTAPAGNHTVTYSFLDGNGCINSDIKTFTVKALPTVDAASTQSACKNSGNVSLTGATPTGGTWTGNYVSSGAFNTNTAPAGNHTVTYSFTDANGCTNSDTKTFTVNALPTVDAGSNQSACKNSGSVSLTGATPTGGAWSGSYVSSGVFNTNTAPAGNHTVTYSFTDANGCINSDTKTFTVNALPTVDAGSTQTACKNSGGVSLTGATPTGGTWSGNYVSSGVFNTNTAPAGNHTVTYSFLDANGCINSDTKTFTVNALPTVDAGATQYACKNSGSIALESTTPTTGGVWSGSYVSSGAFNTNTAPAGNHTVTFTYTDANGCTNSDTKIFTVNALPTVDAGATQFACKNSGSIALESTTPTTGGIWSGSYVSSGEFNTNTAPLGNHTVTYSFTDANGCTNTDTKTFTVQALPTVDAGSDIDLFSTSGVIDLSGYGESPAGGVWSGSYVTAGQFDPTGLPPGAYTVTYTYIDNNYCQGSDTKMVNVLEQPALTVTGDQQISLGQTSTVSVGSFHSYQWYRNNSTISGATSASYTITSPGFYKVEVTTKDGFKIITSEIEISNISLVQDRNYIRERTYKIPVTDESFEPSSINEVMESYAYFDGLGRNNQNVVTQGSPGRNDIVTPVEYDPFGRISKEYLPYTSIEANGVYKTNAIDTSNYLNSQQYLFYQNEVNIAYSTTPFAEKLFEASPLNRVIEQGAPGEDWQLGNHTVKFSYQFNSSTDNVKQWKIDTGVPYYPSNYSVNTLIKNITTDEHENKVIEFINQLGQTILKRVQADSTEWADTYYIYDIKDRLKVVVPPQASANISAEYDGKTEPEKITFLNKWAFLYHYDGRNRMISKKVPGADSVFMIYDSRDRLVLTQDGNQRDKNEWLFTKYDALNRAVLTGTKDTTALLSQNQMQQVVDNFYSSSSAVFYEEEGTAVHGYTNQSYPIVADSMAYLTATYYDDYTIPNSNGFEFVPELNNSQRNLYVKGQITGTKTKYEDGFITTINYYDDKYRIIQSVSNNHKGGLDRTSSSYDFIGNVLETYSYHSSTKDSLSVIEMNDYDHGGRLLNQWHQANNIENPVVFKDLVGVESDGNNLIKTETQAGYNAGAVSVNILKNNEDGWISIEVKGDNRILFGLTDGNTDQGYHTIDYAFFTYPGDKRIAVYENGSNKGTKDYYEEGDILKIERVSSKINYYVNNVLVYSSNTDPELKLMADFTIYNYGEGINNVKMSNGVEVLMISNSYNELGELIVKDLHVENNKAQQSVDYKYNIRGWLTHINDSDQLEVSGQNRDYFGMELLYNNINASLGNTAAYNGNISATRWSVNMGLENVITANGHKEEAYTYNYDAMNRIKGAKKHQYGTVWNSVTTNLLRKISYDLNGNIMNLSRTNSFGGLTDSLKYTYSDGGNQLTQVDDYGDTLTFKDGNPGRDYFYDRNGNMIKDYNKSIDSIAYNHLNLPIYVKKSTNEYLKYIYDAAGIKLAQEVYDASGILLKRTDYIGGMIYENDTLRFVNHSEGRILPEGDAWEYQYHIKDHLGNVRTTFTTKPKTIGFLATMETENSSEEELFFTNIPETRFLSLAASSSPDEVIRVNGDQQMGAGISLPVNPGDTVEMQVVGYYEGGTGYSTNNTLTSLITAVAGAFGGVNGGSETQQAVYNSFDNALGAIGLLGTSDDSRPAAYLNYILFDENMQYYKHGFTQIPANEGEAAKEVLSLSTGAIQKPGFIYVYLSYESASTNWVHFDDLNVVLKEHPVIQSDDYYPFGLTFNSYTRSYITPNNYLYNGKEIQEEWDVYDYGARYYDPAIARFINVDPLAFKRNWLTPYNYVQNNPILRIDPTGALDDYYGIVNDELVFLGSDGQGDNVRLVNEGQHETAQANLNGDNTTDAQRDALRNGDVSQVVTFNEGNIQSEFQGANDRTIDNQLENSVIVTLDPTTATVDAQPGAEGTSTGVTNTFNTYGSDGMWTEDGSKLVVGVGHGHPTVTEAGKKNGPGYSEGDSETAGTSSAATYSIDSYTTSSGGNATIHQAKPGGKSGQNPVGTTHNTNNIGRRSFIYTGKKRQ